MHVGDRRATFHEKAGDAALGKLIQRFPDGRMPMGIDGDGNDLGAKLLKRFGIGFALVGGADEPDRHHLVLEQPRVGRRAQAPVEDHPHRRAAVHAGNRQVRLGLSAMMVPRPTMMASERARSR